MQLHEMLVVTPHPPNKRQVSSGYTHTSCKYDQDLLAIFKAADPRVDKFPRPACSTSFFEMMSTCRQNRRLG
jgi:hypothetical protein